MKTQNLLTTKFNGFFRLSLPLAFLLVFFVSCLPAVDYSKVVQNNSDYDVKVLKGFGDLYPINSPIDTITINKGTSAVVFNFEDVGTLAVYEDCSAFRDSMPMLVYFSDSIKIIPNIHTYYWYFRVISKNKIGGGGKCECRLYLTNEMLEE